MGSLHIMASDDAWVMLGGGWVLRVVAGKVSVHSIFGVRLASCVVCSGAGITLAGTAWGCGSAAAEDGAVDLDSASVESCRGVCCSGAGCGVDTPRRCDLGMRRFLSRIGKGDSVCIVEGRTVGMIGSGMRGGDLVVGARACRGESGAQGASGCAVLMGWGIEAAEPRVVVGCLEMRAGMWVLCDRAAAALTVGSRLAWSEACMAVATGDCCLDT